MCPKSLLGNRVNLSLTGANSLGPTNLTVITSDSPGFGDAGRHRCQSRWKIQHNFRNNNWRVLSHHIRCYLAPYPNYFTLKQFVSSHSLPFIYRASIRQYTSRSQLLFVDVLRDWGIFCLSLFPGLHFPYNLLSYYNAKHLHA